jgi:hypothetical protein
MLRGVQTNFHKALTRIINIQFVHTRRSLWYHFPFMCSYVGIQNINQWNINILKPYKTGPFATFWDYTEYQIVQDAANDKGWLSPTQRYTDMVRRLNRFQSKWMTGVFLWSYRNNEILCLQMRELLRVSDRCSYYHFLCTHVFVI